jgi:anti-sigma factor RsiW
VKHFSEQVWADYVRGLETPEITEQVVAHIAGCPDCAGAFELWKKVGSISRAEASLSPPDGLVRKVKLAFVPELSTQDSWTIGRLVFDSFHQPLTAGVRSGASASRQLMFDAEGTMVDLVLDTQPQMQTVTLVGQVVDKRGGRVAPRKVSVVLWTETGKPLVETTANEFGEFQLECSIQERLRLSVEISGSKPIRIPPINLTPDGAPTVT